jgi:uncharacterized repeat protein (TIGR03803 family)
VLYSFCAKVDCRDGAGPETGVFLDKDGNLYGTTAAGGRLNQRCPFVSNDPWCGVVFEIKPDSTETVLYAFCSQVYIDVCADGSGVGAGVTLKYNKKGGTILYGTTSFGGIPDRGVVYSLSAGTEKELYSFCSLTRCADGLVPESGVIREGGSIIGTTIEGGEGGGGTIYTLD